MTLDPLDFDEIANLAMDPQNGWSIGSFGAIGEFVRDADEPTQVRHGSDRIEIVTPRGAMRIAPTMPLTPIAWDSLSSDGESWGHALALCCPGMDTPHRTVRALGIDGDAIRRQDRGHHLFDLGVAAGAVTMAVRTDDAALIAALTALEGRPLLTAMAVMTPMLRAQPHRVMLSPAGRIEVFQPIPPADGASPMGPHTHMLVKLIPQNRFHSSNVPISDGLQAALSLHPRSPWRTMAGERHAFMAGHDDAFAPLLERFGLAQDKAVDRLVRAAVTDRIAPELADWPETRRGRAKARIVLRRLAAAGHRNVAPWRAYYDRTPIDIEEGEEA